MADVPFMSLSSSTSPAYKLDKYRWLIISIFGLYCLANFFLLFQFTIIANITERFYHVGVVGANSTSLVFMVAFIVFCIPVGQFMEKYDLMTIAVVSAGLTAFGNLLKLFALSPDRFYLILISQVLCGIGQVFMVGVPPKVAGIWFGAEEVSLACGIGVMGCQFGMALGCLAPTVFVPNVHSYTDIRNGFLHLFTIDNILSFGSFILVLLFFRSKPESSPSHAQAAIDSGEPDTNFSYWEAFRQCLGNRDYLLVTFSSSLTWGVWSAMGIVVNQMYLHYFPDDIHDLGVVLMTAVFSGGVGGSLIFGYILDKTHEFKKVSFFLYSCNLLFWIILIICFHQRYLMASNIVFIIDGFCGGSMPVPAFEYITEITYPIPGAFGATLMFACVYMVSIIYTFVLEYIFTTVGFFPGQVLIGVLFAISTVCCLFFSSNFKRRDVNFGGSKPETYGTLSEDK